MDAGIALGVSLKCKCQKEHSSYTFVLGSSVHMFKGWRQEPELVALHVFQKELDAAAAALKEEEDEAQAQAAAAAASSGDAAQGKDQAAAAAAAATTGHEGGQQDDGDAAAAGDRPSRGRQARAEAEARRPRALLLMCDACGMGYLAQDGGPGARRHISTTQELNAADKEHNRALAAALVANNIVRQVDPATDTITVLRPWPPPAGAASSSSNAAATLVRPYTPSVSIPVRPSGDAGRPLSPTRQVAVKPLPLQALQHEAPSAVPAIGDTRDDALLLAAPAAATPTAAAAGPSSPAAALFAALAAKQQMAASAVSATSSAGLSPRPPESGVPSARLGPSPFSEVGRVGGAVAAASGSSSSATIKAGVAAPAGLLPEELEVLPPAPPPIRRAASTPRRAAAMAALEQHHSGGGAPSPGRGGRVPGSPSRSITLAQPSSGPPPGAGPHLMDVQPSLGSPLASAMSRAKMRTNSLFSLTEEEVAALHKVAIEAEGEGLDGGAAGSGVGTPRPGTPSAQGTHPQPQEAV